MFEPSAFEQYMLEMINAERLRAGVPALAFEGELHQSARRHSRWMIQADTFSHTGQGGSSAEQRMRAAGYALTGAWSAAENIAWKSIDARADSKADVERLHQDLMGSPGHRANTLSPEFRAVGIGMEQGDYRGWRATFVTQNYGRTGQAVFLTGVAFQDLDGDGRYGPGEGRRGVLVVATAASGERFETATNGAGGYRLALAPGTYQVSLDGACGPSKTTVTIRAANVKLDLIEPRAAAQRPAPQRVSTTSPSRSCQARLRSA